MLGPVILAMLRNPCFPPKQICHTSPQRNVAALSGTHQWELCGLAHEWDSASGNEKIQLFVSLTLNQDRCLWCLSRSLQTTVFWLPTKSPCSLCALKDAPLSILWNRSFPDNLLPCSIAFVATEKLSARLHRRFELLEPADSSARCALAVRTFRAWPLSVFAFGFPHLQRSPRASIDGASCMRHGAYARSRHRVSR